MWYLIISVCLLAIILPVREFILRRKFKRTVGFKLRIAATWYSSDYVCFQYTTNGRVWHTVYHCDPPLFKHSDEYWYTFEPLTQRFSAHKDFKEEKEKFSSLEKIKAFEAQEVTKMREGNAKLKAERDLKWQEKADAYKRINS
jgi:hypothetical protein